VSESDIGAIKERDPATFTVEAFSDRAFRGTVIQVRQAPQTVQNVVTYDVVVGADNAQFLLKPGMTATVSIVTDQREQVLRIPNQALRYRPRGLSGVQPAPPQTASNAEGKVQVWILRSGRAVAVGITTGLADDTYTEVRGGELHSGDQVVIGEQRAGSRLQTRELHFGP
jgi:HlyD family secretion protein